MDWYKVQEQGRGENTQKNYPTTEQQQKKKRQEDYPRSGVYAADVG